MNEYILGLLLSLVSNTSNHKLAESIAKVESGLDPNLVTHEHNVRDVSVGLFQIRRHTAMGLGHNGDVKHLQQPLINIYYATKYLSECQKKSKTIAEAVCRYNRGSDSHMCRLGSEYSDKVMFVYNGSKLGKRWKKEKKQKYYQPINII